MPEGKSEVETIYGNKEGESNTIRMKFLANPMPTEGQWSIGEVSVPIGASDVEGNFQSSQIQETGVRHMFTTFLPTQSFASKRLQFLEVNKSNYFADFFNVLLFRT